MGSARFASGTLRSREGRSPVRCAGRIFEPVGSRLDDTPDRQPTRAEPSTPRLWTARLTSVHRKKRVTRMRTSDLRPIVEALDREMTRLHAVGLIPGTYTVELLASWAKLVELLELRPPELRACPRCGGVGMRSATRCRSCWARLEPWLPAASA